MYNSFKASVLGKVIGDGQCVALVVNNSNAYTEALFPGVNWTTIFTPVPDAKDLFDNVNVAYFTAIENDHNNPNQVPDQGDVMVFDSTPQPGYANQYNNPAGHTGICDSANSDGYNLLQQNSPTNGSPANVKNYPWKFRPCIGWLRPKTPGTTPPPVITPPSTPTGETIFLPPTTGPWHLYNDDGPYTPAAAKGVLVPSQFGGLTYPIVASKGNGVYVINTEDFGQGAIWTSGSDVVIK